MEKKESSKYQVSEDTARLLDALRKLDEVFADVEGAVNDRFGHGAFDGAEGKDFMEKHGELRKSLGKVIFQFVSESLGDVNNNNI